MMRVQASTSTNELLYQILGTFQQQACHFEEQSHQQNEPL